jgi:hypothetical protein
MKFQSLISNCWKELYYTNSPPRFVDVHCAYLTLNPNQTTRPLVFLQSLSEETEIKAANGKPMKAIDVFSYSLRFFKEHVVEELSDQMSTKLVDNDICWVITVPAIWKAGAKQFMRKAAYDVSLQGCLFNNSKQNERVPL